VNVTVGVLVPSLKASVWTPIGEAGTAKLQLPDQERLPDASVVQPPLRGTGPELPNEVRVTVFKGPRPVPVTVTEVPTAPSEGLREMDEMTVNVAVGLLVPSLTVTV